MRDPILHYLFVFDHKTMDREIVEFGQDIEAALASYAQKEEEVKDDRSIEVVLVGSDSVESVRMTHSKYFPDKRITNGWLTNHGLSDEVIHQHSR